MTGLRRHLTLGALLLAAIPSFAATAAPVDWSGCAVPVIGTDKHAVGTACTSILARTDLGDADREQALITRGRVYHMLKDMDAAIRDFDAAISLAPKDPAPLLRRASIAISAKDYARADILAHEALELDPKSAEAYNTLGVLACRRGDCVAGKIAYDKAIDLLPDYLQARENRIQVLGSLHMQREALQDIQAMLALQTEDLDTAIAEFHGKELSYRTLGRLHRAAQLEAMGRFHDALKAFDDFVREDPGAFSYGWRGWYHFHRDEFDLAKADIDKALTYDPNFWMLHYLAGRVALYQARYEDSVAASSRSLGLHPDEPASSYWERALALRALHRVEEAQKDALTALSRDCCTFLNHKADTLVKLGYLQPVARTEQLLPALRDAAQACMLDEKCW
jgi:tetratricopeptide (TPR) repeat protein